MSVSEDIINGKQCTQCGVCFIKEHGFPVLCNSCYFEYALQTDLIPIDRDYPNNAFHDEL